VRPASPLGVDAPPGRDRAPDVVAPPRLRRRPLLVAGSVASVCAGSLLAVWAWTATSDTEAVIALRSTVHRGELVDREDLQVVHVGVDPALTPVPAASLDGVVGQRAALDLAAGSVVTAESVSPAVLPAAGSSVVGVAVSAGSLPGTPLLAGDRVRVVVTPGEQGPADRTPPVTSATVVSTAATDATAQGPVTVVTVQVPAADAPALAASAAAGRVAVVLDSRTR
jgi:hypothetical protein